MKKIRKMNDINKSVIEGWKSPRIDLIIKSPFFEEEIVSAYENGLFETPVSPQINPQEAIYALTFKQGIRPEIIREIKAMTQGWIELKRATWTGNVPPCYHIELEYIIWRL